MKSLITGAIAGFVFAIAVGAITIWLLRFQVINLFSNLYGQKIIGETKILAHDAVVQQDGKEIGTLKSGTRLIHRMQTESLEEFYLPLGWGNDGKMDDIFRGQQNNDRAFSILEIKSN